MASRENWKDAVCFISSWIPPPKNGVVWSPNIFLQYHNITSIFVYPYKNSFLPSYYSKLYSRSIKAAVNEYQYEQDGEESERTIIIIFIYITYLFMKQ